MSSADRAALVVLFRATGGTSWKRNDYWDTDADLSKWYGVKVNDQGRVVKLDLNRNNLQGAIPKALGSLRKMKQLYLYHNQLTGVIPKELGGLNKLQKLYLHTNELVGTIPEELGDVVNLKELLLHSNSLEGRIPKALGTLTELQGLNLGNNSLSGHVPKELGTLRKLRALRLKGNELSGPIPPSLGDLDALQILALEDNELSGGPADRESLDAWRARLRRKQQQQQAAKRNGDDAREKPSSPLDRSPPPRPASPLDRTPPQSRPSSSRDRNITPPPRHVEPTAKSPAPPIPRDPSPEESAAASVRRRSRDGEDSAARRYELALSSVIGGKGGGGGGGAGTIGTSSTTLAKGRGEPKTSPPPGRRPLYASYDETSDGEEEPREKQQQQQQRAAAAIQTRQLRSGRAGAARSLSSSSSRLRGSASTKASLLPDVEPAAATPRTVTPRGGTSGALHRPPGLASATVVEEEEDGEQESVYRDLIPPLTPPTPTASSEPPPLPPVTPPTPPAAAAASSPSSSRGGGGLDGVAAAAPPKVDEDEALRAKVSSLPGLDKLTRESREALGKVRRLVELVPVAGGHSPGSGAGDDMDKLRELDRLVTLANDLDEMVSRDAEDKDMRQKELALAPGQAAYNTAVRTGLCRAYLAASVVGSSLALTGETCSMEKAGHVLELLPGVPLVSGGLAGFATVAAEAGDGFTQTRRVGKIAGIAPDAAECCSLARGVALRLADGLADNEISAAGGSDSSSSQSPGGTSEEATLEWFIEEVAKSEPADSKAKGESHQVQGGKRLGKRHVRTLLRAVGRDCLEGKGSNDQKAERLASEILKPAKAEASAIMPAAAAATSSKPKETVVQPATPAPAHGGSLEPTGTTGTTETGAGELAALRARLEALEAAKEKQEEELKALRLENEKRQAEHEAWKTDKDKIKRWLASIDKRLPRSSHSSRSSESADAGGSHSVPQERRVKTKEDFWQNSDSAGKKKGGFLTRLRDR